MGAGDLSNPSGIPTQQFRRLGLRSIRKGSQKCPELNRTEDRKVPFGWLAALFHFGHLIGVAFFAQRAFCQAQSTEQRHRIEARWSQATPRADARNGV